MKKTNNNNKTYKSISSQESILLNAMEHFKLFSISDIKKITKWKYSTISNTLFSLKKKGILMNIKKGNYIISAKLHENIFYIATKINSPSYISFWSACSYYGFTEQQLKTIQLVSTKQYPETHIQKFRIETATFKPEKFYGYKKINNFPIAEVEKLIVDCLFNIDKAGGIEEFQKCLKNAWSNIDQKKLKEYLIKFNNKTLFARLGYLLEKLKLINKSERFFLNKIPKGYVLLNPNKKQIKDYNKKWRIIINDW